MDKYPFIIAEIGLNHNGNFNIAKKSVLEAAKAGVSAVKFQNFTTEDFINDKKITHEYKYRGRLIKTSLYKLCKENEYKNEWTATLIKICKQNKIQFISTPTSRQGVDHLKKFNLKYIKNGSDYITNTDLIGYMAKKQFKIILSTGMADFSDVEFAVKTVKQYSKIKPILLHCVSQYPTDNNQVNLRRINTLREKFKTICGFSDHTDSYEAAVQSISHGSMVFEKHFTLDKKLKGPDHFFSLNPKEIKNYVIKINEGFHRLGSEEIKPARVELKFKYKVRLGVMIRHDLKKNQIFTQNDYIYQKNCNGILPRDLKKYIGKKVNRNIKRGSILRKIYFN
ncbi:MAG: N-acetylneuraminate synthase [Candidatus Marinimicrobia bacterium]|nr:N-acetylneuraminate synthase [Candidatus Neomarinimicrobiota bacterium]|tara:strand:+ start:3652 stop:4665 length:1014 start_codon:yes stop_codon:yes gene_type:complete